MHSPSFGIFLVFLAAGAAVSQETVANNTRPQNLVVSIPLESALNLNIRRKESSTCLETNVKRARMRVKLFEKVAANKTTFANQSRGLNRKFKSKLVGNSASLENDGDTIYMASVMFGSQTFLMDLDTGSADTWVRGINCKRGKIDKENNQDSCRGARFDPLKDSSVSSLGRPFHLEYGIGAVDGNIYSAHIAFGNRSVRMPVGVSTFEDDLDDSSDGVLGLAFNSISRISDALGGVSANFMDLMASETQTKNIISFYLSNSRDKELGQVTIGGYDPSKTTGPFQSFPLESRDFWSINFKGARFAVGSDLVQAQGAASKAFVDTGTTLMIVDRSVADGIHEMLTGAFYDKEAGAYRFKDCKRALQNPPVSLLLHGAVFKIPASIYVIQGSANDCYSGIGAGSDQVAILGDTFLRTFVTVFDKENMKIWFVAANHTSARMSSIRK